MLEVTKIDAMNQQDRISGLANSLLLAGHIKLVLFLFEAILSVSSDYDVHKHNDIQYGNPGKYNTQHTVFEAELIAADIDKNHACPK